MKRFLLPLLLFLMTYSASAEHVILCGGPALRKWENLRTESDRHDRWWANFIRASTLRMDELNRAYFGARGSTTWIVYRPGYVTRGKEDGKPYTTWIQEQATKRSAKLVWVSSGDQAISAINSLPRNSITTFDFFGHSNRHCFMLDYGNEIMAVCKAWLHKNDIRKIKRSVFTPTASCQSWGCHTGESMSQVWKATLGIPLIGARGKTDYGQLAFGRMPSVSGSWVR